MIRYSRKGRRVLSVEHLDAIREAVVKGNESAILRAVLDAKCLVWRSQSQGHICITGGSIIGVGTTLENAAAELVLISGWVREAERKHT